MNFHVLTGVLFTSSIIFLALRYVTNHEIDPREPPVIRSKIPVIGHNINMLRYGDEYFTLLHKENPLPIFTVAFLGAKYYIVNTPSLVNAVQKSPNALSFFPFAIKLTKWIGGISANGERAMADGGATAAAIKIAHQHLLPGPSMDALNRAAIPVLARRLEQLEDLGPNDALDLNRWVERTVVLVNGIATWGANSPLNMLDCEKLFWRNLDNMRALIFRPFPSLLAHFAVVTRDAFAQCFIDFLKDGTPTDVSAAVKERQKLRLSAGMSPEDAARIEAATAAPTISNSYATAFWILWTVYSRRNLLEELRREIDAVITLDSSGKSPTKTIDVARLRDSCPLLVAVFQETLRHRSRGTNARVVTEDILLDDQYLLRRGSVVQIPTQTLHTSAASWGADAASFSTRRFLGEKVDPLAFRSFGGGMHTCPGRFFAMAEVLALVASFIARFDMEPWTSWEETRKNEKRLAPILPPAGAVKVRVRARDGAGRERWKLVLTEGKGAGFDPVPRKL